MGSWYRAFLLAPAAFWLGLLIHLLRGDGLSYMLTRHARPMGFLLATTLLYAMGIGGIIFPAGETIRTTIVLILSLNLFVMGVAVAVIDVTEQGEVFWPHFLRALDYSSRRPSPRRCRARSGPPPSRSMTPSRAARRPPPSVGTVRIAAQP
jgi:hypothetical protein